MRTCSEPTVVFPRQKENSSSGATWLRSKKAMKGSESNTSPCFHEQQMVTHQGLRLLQIALQIYRMHQLMESVPIEETPHVLLGMTMEEIMCGKGDYFPGLVPLVFAYLDYINCDHLTRERLTTYLEFIEKRASGELVTPATWIRNFVRNHPAYKGDSVVSDEIAYDLMIACRDIGEGKLHVPELLGDVKIDLISPDGAYDIKLDSTRAQNDRVLELLRRYTNRKAFNSYSE